MCSVTFDVNMTYDVDESGYSWFWGWVESVHKDASQPDIIIRTEREEMIRCPELVDVQDFNHLQSTLQRYCQGVHCR